MFDEKKTDAQEVAGAAQERENRAAGVNTQPQGETEQEAVQGPQNAGKKTEPKAPEAKDTYTHTFKRPVQYESKEFKAVTFYWGRLTGDDMISIENEMQAMNEYVLSPEISASFLSRMAAKAAGLGPDFMGGLPIGEFSKIKNEARNFLIGTGY